MGFRTSRKALKAEVGEIDDAKEHESAELGFMFDAADEDEADSGDGSDEVEEVTGVKILSDFAILLPWKWYLDFLPYFKTVFLFDFVQDEENEEEESENDGDEEIEERPKLSKKKSKAEKIRFKFDQNEDVDYGAFGEDDSGEEDGSEEEDDSDVEGEEEEEDDAEEVTLKSKHQCHMSFVRFTHPPSWPDRPLILSHGRWNGSEMVIIIS